MNLPNKEKLQAEGIEKRIKWVKNKQCQVIGLFIVLLCMCIGSISGKKKAVESLHLCPSMVQDHEQKMADEVPRKDTQVPNNNLSQDDSQSPNNNQSQDNTQSPNNSQSQDDSQSPNNNQNQDDSQSPNNKLSQDDSQSPDNNQSQDNTQSPSPDTYDKPLLTLNALSACLMDASNGRVLYAKDAYKEMPMASTTKIMTLLVTLENANLDDIVTVSSNAAKQPPVQLNIKTGEQYRLGDLVYSLMLESHNDTAVAIAEHVGGSVEGFCDMMTKRAKELGAEHTQFKTPNGLDADGHYTTARDLSLIASYAITNSEFCNIIKTQTYQFDSIDRKRSFTVNNKNRFLYMMEGALGIKTGYTGKAGYCFVGALRVNDKTLVSTVLGSGWPPRKELKWTDTRRLMNFGLDNYETDFLFNHIQQENIVEVPRTIPVEKGKLMEVKILPESDIRNEKMLMREDESVTMQLSLNDYITAPCKSGTSVGRLTYYINGEVYQNIPVITTEDANAVDFRFIFRKMLQLW